MEEKRSWQITTSTFVSSNFYLSKKGITLPDIFRILEFQIAGDFHFGVRQTRCPAAISTPEIGHSHLHLRGYIKTTLKPTWSPPQL